MFTHIKKYSILISSILLLIALVILFWLFPASGSVLGIGFLGLSFVIASYSIVKKHWQVYEQGDISRRVLIRRVILETLGMLLAMVLAGLLARYISEIATKPINNDLTRFVGGIIIGLIVGIGVGFLVRQAWGYIAKLQPE